MTNVSEFITHYQVSITRQTVSGTYSNDTGLYTNGTSAVVLVDLCIQPIREKDRLLLPEAVRNSEIIKIYTETELHITDDKNKLKGDRFTYNSRTYEVFQTQDWLNGIYDIKFFRQFAVLVDNEEANRDVE